MTELLYFEAEEEEGIIKSLGFFNAYIKLAGRTFQQGRQASQKA